MQKPVHSNVRNPLKKIMPYIFGGIIAAGSVSASNNTSEQRFTETDFNNGIKVDYTDITKATRDSVMKPVYELKSKLNPGNDFLEGISVYVTKSADKLVRDNSFKDDTGKSAAGNLKGRSFYSDLLLPRMIFIQEEAHKNSELYDRKTKKTTTIPAMRQTLMHETGHQFDNYFGHDHNADFALKFDSLLYDKERDLYKNPYNFSVKTDNDYKILSEYTKKGGLSDKEEFKFAILKDVCKIRQIPKNSGNLPSNIQYYIQSFDLTKPITRRHVEKADFSRSEIYANLFSYALGRDDGGKDKFVKNFEESYKIVQADIKKYLKRVK